MGDKKLIESRSFTTINSSYANVLFNKIRISDPTKTRLAEKPLKEPPIKEPPKTEYVAIWDTGATRTSISSKIANECNLNAISTVDVNTAGGLCRANVYMIDLWLPNHVVINNLMVTVLEITGADVLIGMDVINRGDFAVSNFNGRTAFSFRYPSIEEISFVDMNQIKQKQYKSIDKNIGRNNPCPCGSGKKYKNCCGKT